MIHDLAKSIKNKNAILFIGAGVSRNLGLPTFGELINKMASMLDYDEDIFHLLGDDYLSLAEYYILERGSIGQLRSWMDVNWHSGVDISKSDIHKMIFELDFPIIYTTNYDRIEYTYDYYGKKYIKIANVSDITKIEQDTTQIVKFHGDFDDDSSIILTESSYFNRLDFETPLDIKLRSDALGKSILFIGYNLSDVNVRYLIYKLQKQWKESTYERIRPKSYIFLTRPNPIKEKILESRGIIPIVSDCENAAIGLTQFLKTLKSLI